MSTTHELPPGNWTNRATPRIEPLRRSEVGILGRLILWSIRRIEKTQTDYNVFLTLARLGRLFPAYAVFLSQLLGTSKLAAAEKELIVLRVGWRLGCIYEWAHHTHMAARLGVTAQEIAAVATATLTGLPPRTLALLAATDELLATRHLSDTTWQATLRHCSADQILELCMFVGHYAMAATIINTTGIQPEPEFAMRTPVHP